MTLRRCSLQLHAHSTDKIYHLLTFSIKTSTGNQVVFLRVWMPNQQRYTFRWVFQYVLTGLIPLKIFEQTRMFMSDGREVILHHILHYLDKYVTPYKDLFLHCLRKDLRFFDISHNSSHEGTNNGMKSCSVAPVLPVLSMTTSARRMTMQSGMTTHRVNEQSSRMFNKKKLWSPLPTSNYLVTTAKSILSKQSQRYTSYSHVSICRWLLRLYQSREPMSAGGTRGIVEETNRKRRRMYAYYASSIHIIKVNLARCRIYMYWVPLLNLASTRVRGGFVAEAREFNTGRHTARI